MRHGGQSFGWADLVSPSMSAHHHPNIQGAKSSSDIKAYIDKDGDTLEWGEFQIDGRSARGGPQSVNDAYAALNTGNKATAMQVIREQVPRDFVRDYPTLDSNFERIFNPIQNNIFISKWDPSSFRVPDDLEQWVGEHFNKIFINADDQEGNNPAAWPSENNRYVLKPDVDRPQSLIIEGPSRVGKIAWAHSLGKHNYLSGHLDFNSRIFSNDVDYNAIDDISPNYLKLKHWKELIGAQRDWQSNCKYGKPVQIKGGVPSIILCNPGEGFSYRDFLDKEENAGLKSWTLLVGSTMMRTR
ncbi:Replication-associated protein [Ancistrocladus abbreviatus]